MVFRENKRTIYRDKFNIYWTASASIFSYLIEFNEKQNCYEAYIRQEGDETLIDVFNTKEDAMQACLEDYYGKATLFLTEIGVEILNTFDVEDLKKKLNKN